jgi:hypothetical protein
MSVRTELRDAIREDVDTDLFLIPDQPRVPDNASATYRWVVTVEQSSVIPGPTFGTLLHELHLMLVVLATGEDELETELEQALELLLEQLITADRDYSLQRADRDVIANLHGYDITLTVTTEVTKE